MPLFPRGASLAQASLGLRTVALLFILLASSACPQEPLVRVAATTLRMPAEGTTLPYKTGLAFGGLFFEQPVQVVFAPGDSSSAFVVERPGRVAIIRDLADPRREVFLDLSAKTETQNGGLLSLAFHPRFAENGFFYVWFSTFANGQRANRLARFRVSPTNPAIADPASETPLITQLTGPGGHDGGMILFGPDGYLYLSVGDGDQNVPEIDAAHQRIDRGFFGGVIRIDVDQGAGSVPPNPHPSVHAGTYSIPADNPFVGATSFNGAPVAAPAVRTEWWAVGLRNPWRMAFDPATSRLWLADVGLSTREEIDDITRGANYGWDNREGFVAGPRAGAPAGAQLTEPIWDYPTTEGFSITGGFVYRGTRFADLAGNYLFADFVSGRIWALVDNGVRPLPATQVRQIGSETGITNLTMDPRTGDVLFTDFDRNQIRRLVPNPNANGAQLPATLAETGVFASISAPGPLPASGLIPAPGVVPYVPTVSFWSDYARKTRWFALPDSASTFGFRTSGAWTLPAGAVWIKHFDLELRRGAPATARRVETRVLVKTADGIYGATYRWNDAQTSAALVAEGGGFQSFDITESDGTTRTQTWLFPSREACVMCHTERGGLALSFNTRQLNRPSLSSTGNQIAELAAAGYLDSRSVPAPSSLPVLADPADATRPVESRARAYLDVNCSQCHQPGGTALGAIDARASTPLSLAGIVNGALLGSAGGPADRVIVPGDAAHSMLLRRMAGQGVGRMPPVGSNERDLAGETLVAAWVAELARLRSPSQLINLAARAQVGTGDGVLIPGFVIAGEARTVLIRGIGPTLSQFGVPDPLGEPSLTLYDSGARAIAANTRWGTAANATAIQGAAERLGAFPLARDSADSALLVTLAPGAYTAQAAGANGTTGVALVEVYDDLAGTVAGSSPVRGKLVNTAVRAQVGTGANVLVPGLVVSDGAVKTVLIRAVGPTIGAPPFNVPGTLDQPVVTLFAGAEAYVTNRGWNNAANATEIRATAVRVGAFALSEGSRDSAMLVSLSPGAYTVQVSGANGSTGVALVEIYEVP